MLQRFRNFIKENQLFGFDSKILLAVSGGVDSVVMCELMRQAGFTFGIAHCNFNLRGKESDEDEQFVENLAQAMDAKFHSIKFNTDSYAKEHHLSIQMAARELRYNWFEKLVADFNYDYVAVAHHLDDQAETFFINLLRGTGLSGLHGISPKQDHVVRPLMFTIRDEIIQFAYTQGLQWREDSSNRTNKYLRNRLRHELIPVLNDMDPAFTYNLNNTIKILRETEIIYRQKIEEVRNDLLEINAEDSRILISWLEEFSPVETWLYELLKPYNFSFSVVEEIVRSFNSISGKIFLSSTHRLVRDRDYLIIESFEQLKDKSSMPVKAFDPLLESQPQLPFSMTFSIVNPKDFTIPTSDQIAYFDYDKLIYPLFLRHRRIGDFFYPLGSNGKKKISDFYIDNKFSIDEKERTLLLTSGENIIWVVGNRADDRFKVARDTKKILKVEITLPEEPLCPY